MDCDYCNTREAEHLCVPTTLGTVANLCEECLQKYGRRPKRAPPRKRTGGPAKTAQSNDPVPRRSRSDC